MSASPTRTYQTRIPDGFDELLSAYAGLMAHVEHCLFAQITAGKLSKDLKSSYLSKFHITARQFNSSRVKLEGKIAAVVESLSRRIATKKQQIASLEEALPRLKNRQTLHQKKRRLEGLKTQLKTLEIAKQQKKPSLCFGTKKLFHAQFHLEDNGYADHCAWKRQWQQTRASEIFLLGSKDETSGNQSCTVTIAPDLSITLRLRLPDSFAAIGKYLVIPNIHFAYGHGTILAAIRDCQLRQQLLSLGDPQYKHHGQAITFRFKKDHKGWRLFATTDVPPPPTLSREGNGVIAVDINSDHLAVVEIDRFGNLLHTHTLPLVLHDLSQTQARARIGDASAHIIALCEKTKKPLVLEDLDFQKKKASLREQSIPYSRMLSSFAYASLIAHLKSRGQAKGIEVHSVNPAYTSLIGRVNFAKRYGITIHMAAALCIGRRFLGFSERMPQGQREIPDGKSGHLTLVLPVRNRTRHVWSQWGQLHKKLPAALKAHFQAVRNTDPRAPPKSSSWDSHKKGSRILSARFRHANR